MSQMRFNFSKNSFNAEIESKKPLLQRKSVINHIKFNSQLDREGAQNFLANSEPGDFIVRPSSKGDDYLALTLVRKKNQPDHEIHAINSEGYPITHYLISPFAPLDDFITKSNNPIQEIENFIKTIGIGTNFSAEEKSTYLKIIELDENRTRMRF